MKKLEIIIRPEKLENLKAILEGCRVNGIMISNVMGYGNQKGYTQMYRGTKYNVNLLPKVKVETVIPKELADPIIDAVVDEINTGNYGDGKIFVYDVQDAIRIRTGEHGRYPVSPAVRPRFDRTTLNSIQNPIYKLSKGIIAYRPVSGYPLPASIPGILAAFTKTVQEE